MNKKFTYEIIILFFIISLFGSIVLSFSPISLICSTAPGQGCDVIHNSTYNFTLNIQNSYYGIFIFIILIFLTISEINNPGKNKEKIINLAIIIGSLIAIYFIYLQIFVLHAYCKYCLVVDSSMLATLLIIFIYWIDKR